MIGLCLIAPYFWLQTKRSGKFVQSVLVEGAAFRLRNFFLGKGFEQIIMFSIVQFVGFPIPMTWDEPKPRDFGISRIEVGLEVQF